MKDQNIFTPITMYTQAYQTDSDGHIGICICVYIGIYR